MVDFPAPVEPTIQIFVGTKNFLVLPAATDDKSTENSQNEHF